jgi:hypothetical protein
MSSFISISSSDTSHDLIYILLSVILLIYNLAMLIEPIVIAAALNLFLSLVIHLIMVIIITNYSFLTSSIMLLVMPVASYIIVIFYVLS